MTGDRALGSLWRGASPSTPARIERAGVDCSDAESLVSGCQLGLMDEASDMTSSNCVDGSEREASGRLRATFSGEGGGECSGVSVSLAGGGDRSLYRRGDLVLDLDLDLERELDDLRLLTGDLESLRERRCSPCSLSLSPG